MMKNATQLWIQRCENLSIFANVGEKIKADVHVVLYKSQAIQRVGTPKWRNSKFRALDDISNAYDKKHGRGSDCDWNEMVRELREII